jgi:hypothetical protein
VIEEMAKTKHQVIIPNGRIIICEKETENASGPMSMFVSSKTDELLQFAKEMSCEAMKNLDTKEKKKNG